MNCVLVTQRKGTIIARNVHEVLQRSYGPGHRYISFTDDPGVVGWVCKRNDRHGSWDVVDHVLQRTTARDRGRG